MDTDQLKELLKAACRDDHYFEPPEGFEEIEEGEWTQEHKYQYCTSIVQHTETGRCFAVHQNRSGSYHSDWYYGQPEVGHEVKKVSKVVTTEVWEAV